MYPTHIRRIQRPIAITLAVVAAFAGCIIAWTLGTNVLPAQASSKKPTVTPLMLQGVMLQGLANNQAIFHRAWMTDGNPVRSPTGKSLVFTIKRSDGSKSCQMGYQAALIYSQTIEGGWGIRLDYKPTRVHHACMAKMRIGPFSSVESVKHFSGARTLDINAISLRATAAGGTAGEPVLTTAMVMATATKMGKIQKTFKNHKRIIYGIQNGDEPSSKRFWMKVKFPGGWCRWHWNEQIQDAADSDYGFYLMPPTMTRAKSAPGVPCPSPVTFVSMHY